MGNLAPVRSHPHTGITGIPGEIMFVESNDDFNLDLIDGLARRRKLGWESGFDLGTVACSRIQDCNGPTANVPGEGVLDFRSASFRLVSAN